jgi:alkylated DNA nucleotide flippase Atl1
MPAARRSRTRSAIEKRDQCNAPEVKLLTHAKSAAFPAGRMLIASPLAIQEIVAKVPEGQVLRFGTLRSALAKRYGADYTCPITTGIFLRIAADAAEEERVDGNTRAMPWWRVVRDDGKLFEKLPGGVAGHAKALAREGIEVTRVKGVPKSVPDVASVAWTPRVRAR